jgi:hypothetical protein
LQANGFHCFISQGQVNSSAYLSGREPMEGRRYCDRHLYLNYQTAAGETIERLTTVQNTTTRVYLRAVSGRRERSTLSSQWVMSVSVCSFGRPKSAKWRDRLPPVSAVCLVFVRWQLFGKRRRVLDDRNGARFRRSEIRAC